MSMVEFTCHICGFSTAGPIGSYNPHFGGHLALGRRWQLDLCSTCVEHLFQRAPEANRPSLSKQAFGSIRFG